MRSSIIDEAKTAGKIRELYEVRLFALIRYFTNVGRSPTVEVVNERLYAVFKPNVGLSVSIPLDPFRLQNALVIEADRLLSGLEMEIL